MSNNCIEIIGLSYLNIFENFSVAFEKGKFITLSGPNNCGKTTLFRILDKQINIPNSILINGEKQEAYNIIELKNVIKTVIPTEITFSHKTVEEELIHQLPLGLTKEEQKKQIKEVSSQFKLTKLLTKSVEILSDEQIVRLQLALATISNPQIILIDNLSSYFDNKELLEIVTTLRKINNQYKTTIVMVTSALELALLSDYMYVIESSAIVIEGIPREVLEKDNILNKAGLKLPFMMDLAVKLRDYDLIKTIELDMDRMVDLLWN